MDKKNHTEPAQTGFDAISGAARALYPGQEGVYYGTLIPYTLGGGDPLDGVEIWKSERGVPHWHYITYGFTELYEKESGDPDESGNVSGAGAGHSCIYGSCFRTGNRYSVHNVLIWCVIRFMGYAYGKSADSCSCWGNCGCCCVLSF